MDLYSGQPYWIIKNPLYDYYNPLRRNLKTKVAIIGSGITGALAAHEMCRDGIDCVVIDKRSISTGSSAASTALLQYEIDVPLCKMKDKVGEHNAAAAFRSCLDSIGDIGRLLAGIGSRGSFERVPSVYLASNRAGLKLIEEEAEIRQKYRLPCRFMRHEDVYRTFFIDAPGALYNEVSGQIDTYAAAKAIFEHNMAYNGLRLYSHSEVKKCVKKPRGYLLQTTEGYYIDCDYVVIAAGFEAGPFLPAKLMKLTTTYALVSQPVDRKLLWHKKSLIWETRDPYIYIRTDGDSRIIVGGEDDDFNDPFRRGLHMKKKIETLEKKFRRMMPHIPFRTDMAWSGTFSSTRDGLPLIGATGDNPRMLFALGYGGNGITFSMVAAQILSNKVRGIEDHRERVFSLERGDLKFN